MMMTKIAAMMTKEEREDDEKEGATIRSLSQKSPLPWRERARVRGPVGSRRCTDSWRRVPRIRPVTLTSILSRQRRGGQSPRLVRHAH